MGAEIFLPVNDTQNLNLVYEKPDGHLNWGIELKGSDVEEDITTPIVVMLHDAPCNNRQSHDALFGNLARMLSERGLPSVSFDFRGCGDSDGQQHDLTFKTMQEDLHCVMSWLAKEEGFKKVIFVACGLGVAPLLTFLNLKDSGFKTLALTLFWPALDPYSTSVFKAYLEHGATKDKDGNDLPYFEYGHHRIGLSLFNQLRQLDPIATLKHNKAPILIQQGTADDTVPLHQIDTVREMAGCEYLDIQLFEGGTNGLEAANLRPHVLRGAQEFILKFS